MKDFFRGLSKLTLEMSLNNYFSLQSFNNQFAIGWVEIKSLQIDLRSNLMISMTIYLMG